MSDPVGTHRLIALVAGVHAVGAFFLDIGHLTVGGDLTVSAGDTAAGQCRKAKQTNETHGRTPLEKVDAIVVPVWIRERSVEAHCRFGQ
jgi:hypothetical protein